jgi:hypothetical protein
MAAMVADESAPAPNARQDLRLTIPSAPDRPKNVISAAQNRRYDKVSIQVPEEGRRILDPS